MSSPVHLYVHFPFCLYKCHYCDFNSHAFKRDQIPFDDYLKALKQEFSLRAELFQKTNEHFLNRGPLATIFMGGGTPSLMPPQHVEEIISLAGKYFDLSQDTEITLEANPGTLSKKSLQDLKSAGINRISVGIQSLDDAYLAAFGRIHTAEDSKQALGWIANLGLSSWNADLMFGFPGQNEESWSQSLEGVSEYAPPHMSCYSFTVEADSLYAKKSNPTHPDDGRQADMLEMTRSRLLKKGYEAYEISNYAKPGHHSRHNRHYWNYGEYIGVGAGAVSFLRSSSGDFGYRTTNFMKPADYMKGIDSASWFDRENIDYKTARGEFMMMGLRVKEGVDCEEFSKLFGKLPQDQYAEITQLYRSKGWLEDDGFRLTEDGQYFANQILADII